jgi:predicted aspartyl protease
MLTGRVTTGREAVVSIVLLGPGDRRVPIEATIDTGFNGYLTLPPSLVSDRALPFAGSTLATLGDARTASLDLFFAAVEWHDGPR